MVTTEEASDILWKHWGIAAVQVIEQFLPDETGLSIADVGGGSGPYAFWLAEKGHKVALFDLMPNHVEEAVSINKKAPNQLTRI